MLTWSFLLSLRHSGSKKLALLSYLGLQKIRKCSLARFFDPECLSDSRNDQVSIAHGSQRDEADPVGKISEQVGPYLEPQARFTHAAGAGEGEEAHFRVSQEGTHCRHLLRASNQRGERRRQVVEPNIQLPQAVSHICTFCWSGLASSPTRRCKTGPVDKRKATLKGNVDAHKSSAAAHTILS